MCLHDNWAIVKNRELYKGTYFSQLEQLKEHHTSLLQREFIYL